MSNFTLRTKTFNVDVDARNWAINAVVNGGIVSLDTLYKVSNFTKVLKRDGLWDKILDMGIFAGGNLNAALTKLKTAPGVSPYLVNNNFVEGDYVERGVNGGLQGDGSTKYLDSKLRTLLLQNNINFAFYVRDSITSQNQGLIGAWGPSSTLRFGLDRIVSGGNYRAFCGTHSASANAAQSNLNSTGLLCANRDSNVSLKLYGNGTELSENITTNNFNINFDISFFLFATNANGSPTNYALFRGSFYSVGKNLSNAEHINLYNSVQQLQTSFGRNV